VYFVECRHPQVLAGESRRVSAPELWQDQYLTALDLRSGRMLWERPIDTADGTVVFYLACGEGKLVLVSSVAAEKRYYVYGWDAAAGKPLWEANFAWPRDNHGRHMSPPAITAGRVFVRPVVIELASGKRLGKMPDGGCGTYALTTRTAVFRAKNVTLWDFETGSTSAWVRLRPDCWLSTIPACGMILSPEGGGGCSCGAWMETSLGLLPKSRL